MMKTFADLKHKHYELEGNKMITKYQVFLVEVMATVGKHSMVRRKGCVPFVVNTKDLSEFSN